MFLDANDSTELLEELLHTRSRYEKLSFDEGPYHTEVFPYTYYSPEEILLGNKDKTIYNKELKGFIEELIVELNMMWERAFLWFPLDYQITLIRKDEHIVRRANRR